MFRGRRAMFALILGAIACVSAASLQADWLGGNTTLLERLPENIQQGSIPFEGRCAGVADAQRRAAAKISAAAAVRIVESSLDSAVVRAELAEESGFLVWRIRTLLKDGNVYVVQIDAGNGRILAARALEVQKTECAGQPDKRDEPTRRFDSDRERRWWEFWKEYR